MSGRGVHVRKVKRMVTRCYLCGGRTVRRFVTAENWWGDKLALVENVPAWVCDECGEAYFDAETCRQLDRLREAPLCCIFFRLARHWLRCYI
jgi:YgiT-type zinc finger domain-containing protein